MLEDESTDDELGVNLQLGERLQINRQPHSNYHNTRARARNSKEHKEYWNGRKKDMCSSSCSTAVNPHCSESASVNGWFVPETPSPYQLGNKKRQNKDRNGEQIAKSKRTCFNAYPDWKEGKIRNRHCKDPQHCTSIPRDCSSVTETSVKAESSATASTSGVNSYVDVNSSGVEHLQKDISPDEKYRDFIENVPSFSEIEGTNSSSSNFSSADLLHGNSKRNGNSALKSYDASLSFPSTSSSGQSFTDTIQNSASRATRGIPLGVQYIDSESDDSNRLYAKRGALKGGKQVGNNHFQNKVSNRCSTQLLESDNSDDMGSIHYHNKVIGKCNRRVVESDDDDSDDSSWQPAFHKHRSRLLLSESEESVEEQSQSLLSRTRGMPVLKNSTASCDSHCSSCNNKNPYIPLPCDKSNDESDHFNSDCYRRHQSNVAHKSKKSYRPRRGPHSKSVNKHFPSCDCNSSGPTGQSKLHSSLRHHRSGSPHPRSLRQRRHSRGLLRTSSGQTNNSSNQSSIKTGLCKEFDPEDSSDVEFFSANSYSESDVSESFGGIEIGSAISASCSGVRTEGGRGREHGISAESSEEEVSVVFAANPPFRDGSNSRRRRHRGTARRRHSRVPSRGSRSQDPVSVSPDPVEQVRQMEEDERLARLLQAQFDAEVVSEECRPEAHHHHHHHIVDSDEDEEIDPVGEISDDMGWIYDESLQSENVAADHYHHHHAFSHSPTFLSPALHRGRGRSRPRMAVLSFSAINNGSGRGRHVRRRYMHGGVTGDPWMLQFARMMGQTLADRSFDSEGADYEALWELAEDVGEAVPRGLNKSEINRLPTRKYINNVGSSDAASSKDFDETVHKRTELNKECQVCLCDYENGDVLRILPCFHEFHTACIDPWLKINHTCPVCRVEVDLEEN